MLAGGFIFGLGQIFLAYSFKYVGIGLAFVINISIGTSGSALIPILWHKGIMGTSYSYVQIIGIAVFVLAVCASALAAADRDKYGKKISGDIDSKTKNIKSGMLMLGIPLAILAGLGSVCQGVTYIWSNPSVSAIALKNVNVPAIAASLIAWVVIFTCAWIPYFIYFLALNIKNKSFSKIKTPHTAYYWILAILIAVGFFVITSTTS